MVLLLVGGVAALILVGMSPGLAAAVAAGHLLVVVGLGALRIWAASASRRAVGPTPPNLKRMRIRRWSKKRAPFVSIHIPICNEPPRVVLRTLRSLEHLDYPHYEVIVLDNNTDDDAMWMPIQNFCRSRSRFRFFHEGRVEGAKAGALTLCRQRQDPRAELIATIDADYVVDSRLLNCALPYFLFDEKVSHLQFPQAYFNGTRASLGLIDDYAHYFEAFLPCADAARASLLTGTLSIIRVRALDAVGGWSPSSITEDAELGVRLVRAGYAGRFAPIVVGRGVMPTDLESLREQRRRWVFGNAQALRALTLSDWRRLPLRGALAVLAQLTAWFSFTTVPYGLFVVGAFRDDGGGAATVLAALSLLAAAAFRIGTMLIAPRFIERPRPRATVRALGARLGLLWEESTAWLQALLGGRLGFVRTDKFDRLGSVRHTMPQLMFALLSGVVALGLSSAGATLGALAAAFLATLGLGVLYLGHELSGVARVNNVIPASWAVASRPPAQPPRGHPRGPHDPTLAQRDHPYLQPGSLRRARP